MSSHATETYLRKELDRVTAERDKLVATLNARTLESPHPFIFLTGDHRFIKVYSRALDKVLRLVPCYTFTPASGTHLTPSYNPASLDLNFARFPPTQDAPASRTLDLQVSGDFSEADLNHIHRAIMDGCLLDHHATQER